MNRKARRTQAAIARGKAPPVGYFLGKPPHGEIARHLTHPTGRRLVNNANLAMKGTKPWHGVHSSATAD